MSILGAIIYLVITKCKHALIKQLITRRVSCTNWWQLSCEHSHPGDRCAEKLCWENGTTGAIICFMVCRKRSAEWCKSAIFWRLNRREYPISGLQRKTEGPSQTTKPIPIQLHIWYSSPHPSGTYRDLAIWATKQTVLIGPKNHTEILFLSSVEFVVTFWEPACTEFCVHWNSCYTFR